MRAKTQVEKISSLDLYDLKFFNVETLKIQSSFLKNNPLKDPFIRYNPVLVPKAVSKKGNSEYPVILVLSGFTGNGPQSFGRKAFEPNFPQAMDEWFYRNKGPEALVVFVDAMTFWGGSQFVNSAGSGQYEDYVIQEILPALRDHYPVKESSRYWCVMGGSSGGYGALHLASRHPSQLGLVAALAPDSAFEISLLPEIYSTLPTIQNLGGIRGVKKKMKERLLQSRRDFHDIINVVGMASCYSEELAFPVDPHTGVLISSTWKEWKQKDPIVFFKKRDLKKIHKVRLDVGKYDQFNLQYGARQIYQLLREKKVPCAYSEFDGGHFDLSSRRLLVWQWLRDLWL